jgi:nucleoid-associated protein YgaU
MTHWKIAILLAALPSLALPQSNALDQARGTQGVQDRGTARTTLIIDGAQDAPIPVSADGTVNLNAAADRVEGATPDAAGTSGPRTAGGQVQENYVIQRGDTLWDLSGKYLDSPWYWPKLWSYNPQIENPHWIYPGNPLRLSPAGAEAPARIDVASAADAVPPKELDDLTRGNIDRLR